MFSKEESIKLKKEFWSQFGFITKRKRKKKWILYNTKIKGLNLKFEAERKYASVSIDFDGKYDKNRLALYEKVMMYKPIIVEIIGDHFIWEKDFYLENGKEICRIYTTLNKVSIFNKECWPKIFEFFFSEMEKLETAFLEIKDFLKD